MKKIKVKLQQLQTNKELTDIRYVSSHTVSKYRQAYRAGAKFPLIIVEQDTLMVVSGNHRLEAMKAEFGDEHLITVIAKQYNNKAEMLTEFAKENQTHGRPMDGFTEKKLFRAMINEGMSIDEISEILKMPVKNIQNLTGQVVSVQIGGGQVEELPTKRGFKTDATITHEQYQDHIQKDHPWPVTSIAEQLTRWLAGNMIERSEKNIDTLLKLKTELDKFLVMMEAEA
jgi:hypothetical protein